jgi:hypothetical protein
MKQDNSKSNAVQNEEKDLSKENKSKEHTVYNNPHCIKMFDYLSF